MKNFALMIGMLLIVGTLSAQCFEQNVSDGRPVAASSTFSGSPNNIVDNNSDTKWISEKADTQWVVIDLGIPYDLCAVLIEWDNFFYATDFRIELSNDNENWETAMSFEDNSLTEIFLDDTDWEVQYFRIFTWGRSIPTEAYHLRGVSLFGTLEAPYQYLTFPALPDRLSTDAPFELEGEATSGLPVMYEVSGPATVAGNVLTLTGDGGMVTVTAQQNGDDDFGPAEPITRSFEAVNPAEVFPQAIITNPGGSYPVVMPELGQMAISLRGVIERPQWFSVTGAEMSLDGTPLDIIQGRDNHFYFYWTPDSYGAHTLSAKVYGSNGNSSESVLEFEVVESTDDIDLRTFDHTEVIAFVNPTTTAHHQMPSNVAAFDRITASLDITCPSIGCDDWDRLAHIDVRTPEGEWVEFIRYITPYGEECSHTIEVTEYASLLQGNPEMRIRIGTFQRGWAVTLDLSYEAGQPEYQYSKVEKLWYGYHAFGHPQDPQPAAHYELSFEPQVEKATLYLVGTGHGWGENNTSNAAEFFEATHHVLIDDVPVFEHHNWTNCDPNPDGCQPQGGTWQFDRAGWCPGAISPFFEYEMDPYLQQGPLDMFYRLQSGYVDFCHPANPGCVNGITCPNCNDGFNPHLVMATNLVTYSNSPIEQNVINNTEELDYGQLSEHDVRVYPNPVRDELTIEFRSTVDLAAIVLFDNQGKQLMRKMTDTMVPGQWTKVNTADLPNGLYHLVFVTQSGTFSKKVIKE